MTRSPSQTCVSPSSPLASVDVSEVSDNNLQPFFILHKALRKSRKKSSAYGGTTINVEMPPYSTKPTTQEENDAMYERYRLEAFHLTWSKIDSTVKEVLREINMTLFEEIRQWVFKFFPTIRSTNVFEIMKPYPILTGATCKRIPTALVFTKNVEFIDDLLTFQDLMVYMKSNGCHAAYLSALDFSIKNGIGICLRSLCRQLVSDASDAADVSLIASWYCQSENYNKPIIVIIDGLERCDGAVLADLIKLLSEWVMKIPIILIMGVTTTFEAPKKLLPSSVLHNLHPFKFTLESPGQKMDSLIEAVLVRPCSGIFIGHKIAVFLRNHFIRHDGTITSFLKALKLVCVKHFIGEPLSFLCLDVLREDCEAFLSAKCEPFTEVLQSCAFDLQYCQSGKPVVGNNLAQGLSELKRLQNNWSAVVLALIGDPRGATQNDLLKSDEYLQSTSSDRRDNALSASTHDTAIMYNFAQEYDEFINLHDWYHCFKTKFCIPISKAKRKIQYSPSFPASKKGKPTPPENESIMQARFCRAVTELQITGLVRMPSKRRPDFLQRITFDN